MNKNYFLIFSKICLIFLISFKTSLCVTPFPPISCYTSPKLAADLLSAYQNKDGDRYDALPVFIKNGIIFFRDIRKGYLGEKDLGQDGHQICSYMFNQLELGNIILCEHAIPVMIAMDENHAVLAQTCPLLIMGSFDHSLVIQVLEYVSQNTTRVGYDIYFPTIEMNKSDVLCKE
jgi:hypothetical protein